MKHNTFDTKWSKIEKGGVQADERSLFVDVGEEPITQRQLNLYYYFLFISDVLKKTGARDVLEVGCGRGTISLYLNKHLGLKTTLLDNVSDAIALARDEFKKHGRVAKFYTDDVLKTPFRAASFDAIVSIGLAEHFDKEQMAELFAEQHRLLKSGGVMVSLNIPRKFSIQFLNTIMRFFKKLLGLYKEDLRKDYFRNTFKAKDFKNKAEEVGFCNVEITHVCPFPIYVPVAMSTDKKITTFNKFILKFRKFFQLYPYKASPLFAQAHFLVGQK